MGENPDSGFKGLRLHNTLTRTKQDFVPIDAGNVRIYVCGPTVYDDAHIGNARPAIVFDVLYRLLKHLYERDGGKVTYVRNITDIDDKIIDRARRDFPDMALNEAIAKVTAETEAQYHADVNALGCLEPDVEPRATEHIPEMVVIVRILIEKNYAYEADDHVLFNVKSWKNAEDEAEYGKLSRRPLDEMIAGARVEVAPYKRDPVDFVLWKPSSAEEPGWDSPWGRGRPGWHLECSAMSEKHLGKIFDIHGGGVDLVFPHHENEIAQSRCAHGTDVMANYWMHNGFLQVEGRKMAKSEGNFVTIREILSNQYWPGEVVRLAMLQTHYREPINWTEQRLIESRREHSDWARVFHDSLSEETRHKLELNQLAPTPDENVVAALTDDLNTPKAIGRLRELRKLAERGDIVAAEVLGKTMIWLGLYRYPYHDAYDIGGVSGHGPPGRVRPDLLNKYWKSILDARAVMLNDYVYETSDHQHRLASLKAVNRKIAELAEGMRADGVGLKADEHFNVDLVPIEDTAAMDHAAIDKLIATRNAARKAKNFKEADCIRDELAEMGIQLKDAKDPETGELVTTWEIKR